MNELASRLGMPAAQLSRAFLRETGQTPSAYLKAAAIACAERLLATTQLSTTTIAYRAGFGTRTTFFRAFKRATVTPETFRARCRR